MKEILKDLELQDFERIAAFSRREIGIVLDQSKMRMVQARLSRHIKKCGHKSYSSYLDFLDNSDDASHVQDFISLLTTNMTSFFREPHHFELLRNKVIPSLVEKKEENQCIRVWSAGCSFGQEAFSIAMTFHDALDDTSWDSIKILATDIDKAALTAARSGQFSPDEISSLPAENRLKFTSSPHGGHSITIADPIRRMIAFKHLNLMEDWPMTNQMDIVFCRNVLIYFSSEVQAQFLKRFAKAIKPGGWLFLGHSERMSDQAKPFFKGMGLTAHLRTTFL